MITRRKMTVFTASTLAIACLKIASPAIAGQLSDAAVSKIEAAKARLVERAAQSAIVDAVRQANANGRPSMTSGKWVRLDDNAAAVVAITSTATSKMLRQWEGADPSINKLFLRDQAGNLVAGSRRPLLFNNLKRPPFANGIKGRPWHSTKVKPDPTTQVPSVHISAPVIDGGKFIGVLHAAVPVG